MHALLDGLRSGRRVTWVESLPYARRVFGKSRVSALDEPSDFVLLLRDAQQLLESDVVTVPLEEFYTSPLEEALGSEAFSGLDEIDRACHLWNLEKPKAAVLAVLSGLRSLYGGRIPLALRVPSPSRWLALVVPETPVSSFDEDVVDAAAMYCADYLRALSQSGLSALVLDDGESSPHPVDLYEPVWNVGRHYDWVLGGLAGTTGCLDRDGRPVPPLDFVLYGDATIEQLLPVWEQKLPVGGGLDRPFWTGETSPSPDLPAAAFGYGTIPEDATPEIVLARLRLWRDRLDRDR